MAAQSLQAAFDAILREYNTAQHAQPLPPKDNFSDGTYIDAHEFATHIAKLQAVDLKYAQRAYFIAIKVVKYLGGNPVINFDKVDKRAAKWYNRAKRYEYADLYAMREIIHANNLRYFMDAARELVRIPV